MTVRELIARFSKFDPNTVVKVMQVTDGNDFDTDFLDVSDVVLEDYEPNNTYLYLEPVE